MPEQRGAQHHRERMADAIRDEIVAILEGELADPRIGLATVSEVCLAPDGKSAHVLVEVPGDDKEVERTLQGLEAARGYIRHEICERLRLRRAPEMFFQVDRSQQYGDRIDQLLKRAHKREKQH
ncbi:MAG TPA: 30S ribosome-binding factor RbfA [Terriglobales bacterium]|nr:30S ribosome-binding factor RbfA [Terriglobales bacterium]